MRLRLSICKKIHLDEDQDEFKDLNDYYSHNDQVLSFFDNLMTDLNKLTGFFVLF